MSLVSLEISGPESESPAKAVLVDNSGSKVVFKEGIVTNLHGASAYSGKHNLRITYDSFDFIHLELNVPPVNDANTLDTYIRSHSKESLEDGLEHLILYKRSSIQPDAKSNNYDVFAVPDRFFSVERDCFSEKDEKRIEHFSVTQLTLAKLSEKYFHSMTAFHAYADGNKIIITVSKGKDLLYTRFSNAEKDMFYEEGDDPYINSFYENINLTYMYVSQNRRIPLDCIILSGSLAESEALSAMIAGFTDKPQLVLCPGEYFTGCSSKEFHEYVIPLGNCISDESNDLRPLKLKKFWAMKYLLTTANVFLVLAVLFLIFLNIGSLSTMFEHKSIIEAKSRTYKERLSRLMADKDYIDKRKYEYAYINKIKEHENSSLRLIPEIFDILEISDFTELEIKSAGGNRQVLIKGQKGFNNLKEIQDYRKKIEAAIDKVAKNEKLRVRDSSNYNWDTFTSDVVVRISEVSIETPQAELKVKNAR